MKIIAILSMEAQAGGGYNQALNAILQMQRVCQGRHELSVVTTEKANLPVLATLGIEARWIPLTLVDQLLAALQANPVWQMVQHRFRFVLGFERRLRRLGCDLVYLTAPKAVPAAPVSLNHIASLWDICHLQCPEFPEVREFNTAFVRDRVYLGLMRSAVLTLTDSEELADKAALHYGIERDRLLAMPFAPAPLLPIDAAATGDAPWPANLPPGPYFFYPANIWPHKNHVRILQALDALGRRGWTPRVVFSGRDQGTRAHLEDVAARLGLSAQVQYLDFVAPTELARLYRHALAVVMPTYFGPTNLPPMEAWAFGTPLIYSSTLANQAADAALLVHPDDAQALAQAMWDCRDPAVQARLRQAGRERLAALEIKRREAEAQLGLQLDAFALRRQCWA